MFQTTPGDTNGTTLQNLQFMEVAESGLPFKLQHGSFSLNTFCEQHTMSKVMLMQSLFDDLVNLTELLKKFKARFTFPINSGISFCFDDLDLFSTL